jgi:hypothetical protein
MAHLDQSNFLLVADVFAFTQFYRDGVKQVDGGIELVMATFIQMIKLVRYGK